MEVLQPWNAQALRSMLDLLVNMVPMDKDYIIRSYNEVIETPYNQCMNHHYKSTALREKFDYYDNQFFCLVHVNFCPEIYILLVELFSLFGCTRS